MTKIAESWSRIQKWLHDNAPEDLHLPEGVTDDVLDEVENRLGIRLPKQMRESYSLHDGSARTWIFDQGYLMPLFRPQHLPKRKRALYDEVVDSCVFMRNMLHNGNFEDRGFVSEPIGPIKTDWWLDNWLPITSNSSGDHLCVDLSPAKGGKKGQIIDWWHERGATSVIAPDFQSLLSIAADKFEAGQFEFDKRSGKVTKVT